MQAGQCGNEGGVAGCIACAVEHKRTDKNFNHELQARGTAQGAGVTRAAQISQLVLLPFQVPVWLELEVQVPAANTPGPPPTSVKLPQWNSRAGFVY